MGPKNEGCRYCDCPTPSVLDQHGPTVLRYETKKDHLMGQSQFEQFSETGGPSEGGENSQPAADPSKPSRRSTSSLSMGRMKRVSSWVFITEIEEWARNRRYQRELEKSLKERRLWQKFKRKLRRVVIGKSAKNTGPDWYQDLSPNQMKYVDSLREDLRLDVEQGILVRTKSFLTNLGVNPPLPDSMVKLAVRTCDGDPVRFLFIAHKKLVSIEEEEYSAKYFKAKQAGKKISPFSLNERLLLSAVFYVHYPIFLEKLDKVLPPPWVKPPVLLGKKVPKKKKTYSSPYLEPQPIREKCWFEERADEEVEREVARKLEVERTRKERIRRRAEVEREQREKIERLAAKAEEKKRKEEEKQRVIQHQKEIQRQKRLERQYIQRKAEKKERKMMKLEKKAEGRPKQPVSVYFIGHMEDLNSDLSIDILNDVILKKDADKFKSHEGPSNKAPNEQLSSGTMTSIVESCICDLSTFQKIDDKIAECITSGGGAKKLSPVECFEEDCSLVQPSEVPMDEFELWKRRIGILPPEQQLSAAVKFLCDEGDPLAILPMVDAVPVLTRWFEIRRGVKLILTEEDKDELMKRSKDFWDSKYGDLLSIPCPTLPPEYAELRFIPYEIKQKIDGGLQKQKAEFRRSIKLLLVDNSRDLFPSMYTQYFTSPLNVAFRGTYFTYMPSRETDVL